ncbi:hypothetical protein CRUP_011201 [Coryphaenoides rupestris]|nr:hypothetical protein CRUP_011201 [Coryphaenoides rupestris]
MHTRASSRHKPEDGPGETDNKGEPQHPKEPSTSPSSSSSSSSPSSSSAGPEGGGPSKAQQLKKVFKEYGAVGVSFHICMSLMSLGMFYLLVSSGIDMAAVLCKLGFSEAVVQSKMAAGTSTFVLAYAVHKLFAPVRISITLVSVPLLVRYLRKTGLFKPPPTSATTTTTAASAATAASTTTTSTTTTSTPTTSTSTTPEQQTGSSGGL